MTSSVTKPLKNVFIILAILFVLIFTYLLGVTSGISTSNQVAQTSPPTVIDFTHEITNLNRKLETLLSGTAEMSGTFSDGLYDPSTFHVNSPQLEGKEVRRMEYEFRDGLIVSRWIDIDENLRVKVWTLERGSEQFPFLPDRMVKNFGPLSDFPIFSGYENRGSVAPHNYISEQIPLTANPNNSYVSKNGITAYRRTTSCPKSVCTAELRFHTTKDYGDTQIFIEIVSNVDDWDEANVVAAFARSEEFLDSLLIQNEDLVF